MADKSKISDVLEHLLNNEQEKAEELFHEYVVAKSREIYEGLIESELDEESKDEDEDDEEKKVKEDGDDVEEDQVDEEFEDLAFDEAGDSTDDLMKDIEADDEEGGEDEMGDEEGEEDEEGSDEPATKDDVQELAAAIDELQAAFDQYVSGEENEEDNMPGIHDADMKDDFETGGFDQIEDLETVREYVEKVPAAKMGDNGANAKSVVAGKNDMGGTTANILSSKEEAGVMANQGQLKGSSLFKGTPKEDNAGNINVPGGKAGSAFSKKEPGHGAEKAGAKESGANTNSIIRGSK